MEQYTYERPREKMRRFGAAQLSLVELVQIIVGSGSAYVSSAKLAREIEGLLSSAEGVSYETLIAIKGLGVAKACQLLAAIELGARVQNV